MSQISNNEDRMLQIAIEGLQDSDNDEGTPAGMRHISNPFLSESVSLSRPSYANPAFSRSSAEISFGSMNFGEPASGESDERRLSLKRKRKMYSYSKEYSTHEEAQMAVKREKIWTRKSFYQVKKKHAIVEVYRCKQVKWKKEKQCPAQIKLMLDTVTGGATLYQTEPFEHDHESETDFKIEDSFDFSAII